MSEIVYVRGDATVVPDEGHREQGRDRTGPGVGFSQLMARMCVVLHM
ncbi:hypothetical protein [Streptomyces hygroscopicus]|nr:hypothetical protein [Streptomyces hygroscopicus]